MTTQEIKNLIDQKIAGQGSMVDVGGALPTILKEIVDAVADAENAGKYSLLRVSGTPMDEEGFSNQTEEEAAAQFGISVEDFRALMTGKVTRIITNYQGENDMIFGIVSNGAEYMRAWICQPVQQDDNRNLILYERIFTLEQDYSTKLYNLTATFE